MPNADTTRSLFYVRCRALHTSDQGEVYQVLLVKLRYRNKRNTKPNIFPASPINHMIPNNPPPSLPQPNRPLTPQARLPTIAQRFHLPESHTPSTFLCKANCTHHTFAQMRTQQRERAARFRHVAARLFRVILITYNCDDGNLTNRV